VDGLWIVSYWKSHFYQKSVGFLAREETLQNSLTTNYKLSTMGSPDFESVVVSFTWLARMWKEMGFLTGRISRYGNREKV
jgi:hypothetical protein